MGFLIYLDMRSLTYVQWQLIQMYVQRATFPVWSSSQLLTILNSYMGKNWWHFIAALLTGLIERLILVCRDQTDKRIVKDKLLYCHFGQCVPPNMKDSSCTTALGIWLSSLIRYGWCPPSCTTYGNPNCLLGSMASMREGLVVQLPLPN